MINWKKLTKWSIGGLSALALYSSVFIVDQSQQAVVTRFGNPKHVILNPLYKDEKAEASVSEAKKNESISTSEGAGLYFKIPFIDSVKKFDKRMLRWDGAAEQIPTADKKYIWDDSTVRWYIEDPLLFLRTVGSEQQAYTRLDDIIDSITRNVITKRNLIEIVRSSDREMQVAEEELKESTNVGSVKEGRAKIMEQAYLESDKMCKQFGIGIVPNGYLITGLTYVDEVKTSVEERMRSERMRIAEKYKSEGKGEASKIAGEKELVIKGITSEAYKKSQEIKGKADAEVVKIYGEAFGKDPGFYQFMRRLEVYEKLDKETELLVGTDNDLFGNIKDYSDK